MIKQQKRIIPTMEWGKKIYGNLEMKKKPCLLVIYPGIIKNCVPVCYLFDCMHPTAKHARIIN